MKNNFDIVVQKFGGSSVATPEKIREVALFIKERLTSVPRICVVVSAMGHTTNELLRLAHEVNSNPSKRELDMLISCGERTSMALLAMALHGQGISALSLTGSQSGIITDEEHSGAEIVAIRPERVHQAFALNQVVLIAGFQGMSRSKEITTLKRGGSDTTAVAMAAALGAKACEIYSDVCGVMDIDPRVIETAEILPEITLSEMSAMSLYGAKVMAYDAALLAEKLGIELLIAKTGDQKGGTSIREVAIKDTKKSTFALTHLLAVVQCKIPIEDCHTFNAGYFLCGHMKEGFFVAYGSNDLAQELMQKGDLTGGFGLITVHLHDQSMMASALSRITELLTLKRIKLYDAILGYKHISLLIVDNDLEEALMVLYDGLKGLEEKK